MKICFTGGGSAGHIFPAFSVDRALLETLSHYDRFWIGRDEAREKRWIVQKGFRHYAIATGKLRRYFSLRTPLDLFLIVIGFFQSLSILHKERPDLLFSKGGYVSVGPLYAAWCLKIPTITHESDATGGLATRLNGKVADSICIPFKEASASYPKKMREKLVVTGVPTQMRKEKADPQRAFRHFNLPPERDLVVVLGGSLGAKEINELIEESLDQLLLKASVVHQTGSFTQLSGRENYRALPFITEILEDVLAAATLVISRAGATALTDYLEMEKPMLLIPLSLKASRGDQIENARRLEEGGAAVVLKKREEFLSTTLFLLHERKKRESMVQNGSTLYARGADKRIASHIVKMVEHKEIRRR